MSEPRQPSTGRDDNRREFIRGSSLWLASALPSGSQDAATKQRSEFRVALVGCGRSGMDLLRTILPSERANVKVVALADLFEYQVQRAVRNLKGRYPNQFSVDNGQRFFGSEAFLQLLEKRHPDLVILAASPHFRPLHLQAAVQHKCNAHVVSPPAADARGCDSMLATLDAASQAGIRVTTDTHSAFAWFPRSCINQSGTIELGQVGEIQGFYSEGPLRIEPVRDRSKRESDLEFLVHNSSYHASMTGPLEVQVHTQHALLAESLLATLLERCTLLSRGVDDQGYFSSEMRLQFAGGSGLTSRYRLAPLGNKVPKQAWILGSEARFDLLHRRLVSRQGQVLKRLNASECESIDLTALLLERDAPGFANEASRLATGCHLKVLRALDEAGYNPTSERLRTARISTEFAAPRRA